MKRPHAVLFLIIFLFAATTAWSQSVSTRQMRLTYVATIDLPEADTVRIWIPLPRSSRHQTISNVEVEPDLSWQTLTEQSYGNSYLYNELESIEPTSLEVRVSYDVSRRIALFDRLRPQRVGQDERRRNLMPDKLVTISPRIDAIGKKITEEADHTIEEARAIYDYVLETMTYDKSKPGWGRGDTERACDVRSGNCTDFHSLFISLARSREIPSRFVMGVPVPAAASGTIDGYHCWAEFYLDSKGWVPVDISEAWKSEDPAVHNFLFGNLDFDRVMFTMGRDLVLENQEGPPLNYFIYPYVEVDGAPWAGTSMQVEYRTPPRKKLEKKEPQ
ncbi:MAG: transglutaminase domain-containing protein [Thermoanaerobaculia bacterium]|nr:transglutaminase domain-containing protein [Thermoanaerobaculia bacterium]